MWNKNQIKACQNFFPLTMWKYKVYKLSESQCCIVFPLLLAERFWIHLIVRDFPVHCPPRVTIQVVWALAREYKNLDHLLVKAFLCWFKGTWFGNYFIARSWLIPINSWETLHAWIQQSDEAKKYERSADIYFGFNLHNYIGNSGIIRLLDKTIRHGI